MKARICITGIWHQGSVLAACLADLGHDVWAVADEATAAALGKGEPPLHEPGLGQILERSLRAGCLRVSTNLEEALAEAEFAFLSTDTPVDERDEPDVGPLFELARAIGMAARGDLVLCVTAQVPVGTTAALGSAVQEAMGGSTCEAVYVPEFLRLGTAVETFVRADRFVVGADTAEVAARVAAIFRPLGRPIVLTTVASAEMAKHASNAFLATSISFINEIADLCEPLGADPLEVARILKLDHRIGPHAFLAPGLGYAGGTLGRELRALQRVGAAHDLPTSVVDAVTSVNATRPRLVRRRLERALGSLNDRRIALFGLTYKPGTSTMRRAISLEIARDLQVAGADVTAFDPLADRSELVGLALTVASNPYEAADRASAVVVLTEWDGVQELDLKRLRALMVDDVLLDTRNVWSPEAPGYAGFRHLTI